MSLNILRPAEYDEIANEEIVLQPRLSTSVSLRRFRSDKSQNQGEPSREKLHQNHSNVR